MKMQMKNNGKTSISLKEHINRTKFVFNCLNHALPDRLKKKVRYKFKKTDTKNALKVNKTEAR